MQIKKNTPFSDLVDKPGQIGLVTQKFEKMIFDSFAVDAARKAMETGSKGLSSVTMAETKRRFDILADWFKTLRGDMGWSVSRTLDELPRALRAQLDGEVYVPSVRSVWAP